ncbi:MAG: hypothetical protein V1892_02605 [bacterium]
MDNKQLTKDDLFRWLSNKIGGASMDVILETFLKFSDRESLFCFVKELENEGLIYKYNGEFWIKK